MNGKHIKVFLIEDNPGDVQLIREMLAKVKGISLELECADRLSKSLRKRESITVLNTSAKRVKN
ncbi:MAG TPA: hypothetical protein EYP78_03300 [Candidatus Omnitrophica bacterium]|nr:hypothetical protein [Candidatus Omnitrophota bacterium]